MDNSLKILQMIFYLVIGSCTIYSLWLTRKQSDLIFKPVIGVMDSKTWKTFTNTKDGDIYENVSSARADFIIRNVGNFPVKNFRIKVIGKIGDVILPYKKFEEKGGIMMLPQNTAVNNVNISKDILDKLLEKKERLIYKVEFFYTDWNDSKEYNYSSYFEIVINNKSPLNLAVHLIPEVEFWYQDKYLFKVNHVLIL